MRLLPFWRKCPRLVLWILPYIAGTCFLVFLALTVKIALQDDISEIAWASQLSTNKNKSSERPSLWNVKPDDFEDFDSEVGTLEPIVPNIIHFLRFDLKLMSFSEAVCILAAYKNHRPDRIYFHSDVGNFTGKHWLHVLKTPGFAQIYEIKPISLPETIFGQKFDVEWHKPHASDVTRIRILMQYGGIFLDNDSYVIKSLNEYRHFEMSLNWDFSENLGTQTLIAHKDARFLKLWLESYRDSYDPNRWYYNAGERPTKIILQERPELVHRVTRVFGADVIFMPRKIFTRYWDGWRNYTVIHLLMNHREYMDKENFKRWPEFDDKNIFDNNFTFGEMAREAYF